MPRQRLTKRERAAMWEVQGGLCGCGCGTSLDSGPVEEEHTHPVALGGPPKPDKLWLKACHARKTNGSKATSYGSDKHAIAKTKRLEKKHGNLSSAPDSGYRYWGESRLCNRDFAGKIKRRLPSRKFSGWRKMNGEVVRRG